MEISEEIKLAMINAAKDIAVAKINAKGNRFDGYTGPMNWFRQSLIEVKSGFDEVVERKK